ncbi:AAA family ATPase [Sphingomonas sp. RP10(2022)]|uniref:AAA family ATPase n=1 Tax=Sphingomonas liriopis TaxID=2949094 RepID=A0A9X2HRC5_9SPHN|nr:AAA family ATPase [Sphingomonas liriopis]MCP3734452.1 AAA family ATPase [Sphingomonas liriopis]
MYEDHFGLSGRPFQLTPDARFWYETATHRKAMAYLGYGLAQGEGFVVVTGDIGAGKTTLVGHLTGMLDSAALNVITVVSTAIPADDLLRIVATGLGVDPAGLAKAQLLTAIERGLHAVARSGRRTLLIVDEAQALPVDALEELRMLSNFQAGGHALLQILLLGQPEFRERLHGSDRLEQLRQRVIAIHHLDPMEPHEVADYIAHRLSVVDWQGRPDFAEDAFEALYQGSGGVPRRLNQLAGRVMLAAAIEGLELIDGRVVRGVLRDLHADLPMLAVDAPAAAVVPEPQPEAEAEAEAEPEPEPAPTVRPEPVEGQASPDVLRQAQHERIEDVANATDEPDETSVRRFVPRTTQWLDPLPDEPAASPPEDDRIVALEARVAEQEEALRRVLTLLVDWVEADRGEAAAAASAVVAGVAEFNQDHVPIRAPAAWDHAA